MEAPLPDGTVEYTFNFIKDDLMPCKGKIVHASDDPDNYPFAYDETPKYKPNEEEGTLPIEHYVRRVVTYLGPLKSVTQNTMAGLSLKAYVKMGTQKWLQIAVATSKHVSICLHQLCLQLLRL